jgi:2-haloacid dehalogenase
VSGSEGTSAGPLGGAPIEAVVFDIGGVLLDWDPRHLYRKLFDDESEMNRFLTEVCTLQWHAAHDRGVPMERSCAELAAANPLHAELIQAWAERSEEMVAGPISGTVEILGELRAAGVPCYALTNMEAETYPKRVQRFPFLSWFDGTVVSGFERTAKPDLEIFEVLLARFGLVPATTVLIDDSPANLEAARRLGMKTVQFRSPAQLRRWLEQARLLPDRERAGAP